MGNALRRCSRRADTGWYLAEFRRLDFCVSFSAIALHVAMAGFEALPARLESRPGLQAVIFDYFYVTWKIQIWTVIPQQLPICPEFARKRCMWRGG